MRITKRFVLSVLGLALSIPMLSVGAQEQNPPSFYEKKEEGWFWHEPIEELEQEEVEEPKDTPAPAQAEMKKEPEKVPLDVDWLKENIPVLMKNAINNPTPENIAAYAYAQRLMMDMSSRFASRMMDFMSLEHELSEENRRPTSAFSLRTFKDETAKGVKKAIDKIGKNAHVWFFFRSDCPYCAQQIPILKELARRYDLDVLAVSMDGETMPGLTDFDVVVDTNYQVSSELNVQYTPTIFIVSNDGENFANIAEGLTILPDLEDRLLLVAQKQGFITEEDYMYATNVRDINVVAREDGTILADKAAIEEDPGYLADLLRERLRQFEMFGRTKARGDLDED